MHSDRSRLYARGTQLGSTSWTEKPPRDSPVLGTLSPICHRNVAAPREHESAPLRVKMSAGMLVMSSPPSMTQITWTTGPTESRSQRPPCVSWQNLRQKLP